ncbi:pyridoxal phosphate-dependent aminotransferase [Halomontanus rarus]|uniref:pyridoxal phosphate-dependent aminotransferase n=1 Tax=Halomontanus rarus TaxID=3034020 RepID=UPI0023E7912B|nr:aminotransferase class I/II-fold pyridoxal phosphate-dependent enzyme [Halovivax sp. TS33]
MVPRPSDSSRTSERVRRIEPQRIRVMFDRAAALEADSNADPDLDLDLDLVHLEIGEPDFETPTHVVEAAHEAAAGGATNYTANAGILELREALSERIAEETGRRVDPASEISVTTGGVEAHHLAVHTVADPGDEIVVPTPAWPNSISQAELASAVPVQVPMPAAEGFAPDPERIVDAIGPETAAVVLTSPSNPTGRVFDADAIERVLEAAVDHEAYVLADEVYRALTYDATPPSVASVADREQREWVLTIDSVSKRYAMTGWRVGWISGPADVIGEIVKIRESSTSSVNAPAQYAALEALTGPREPFEAMRDAFGARREYVVDRLESIPELSAARPEGAFYAFVDVRALEGSSWEITERLLEEYGVVTAPGTAFGDGGEGYIRLSFANDLDRLEMGLDRLEAMVRAELESDPES